MATVKTFADLEIWKLAVELHDEIFMLTKGEQLSKDFALKDQMNRSAGSIMDNIAEGFGRGGRLEFVQFLAIARGSVSEIQSQLTRCLRRKYIQEETFSRLHRLADKTGNKIGALIKYLNSSEVDGPKFKDRISNQTYSQPKPGDQKQEITNPQQKTRDERRETINTSSAAKPLGAYPHARRVGNLLFLSGIGSRQAGDNSIPGLVFDEKGIRVTYDIEAECHSCFANVKAVLESSGSRWENIIDVTVFLTNMKDDFEKYNKIYGEYFTEVQACRTTVEVKSLPTPIAIELKVIATID